MMDLTKKQTNLLKHMLGADDRYMKKDWGYRNHYCTSDNKECKDRLELEKMEVAGLVTSGEMISKKFFWATKAGAVAIGFKPYQLRKTKLAS